MGFGNTLMHATLTATVWIPVSSSPLAPTGREVLTRSTITILPETDLDCQFATQDRPDIDLQKDILFVVTMRPGIDDEEIARSLGISAFEASLALREMERQGIVLGR